MYAKWQNGKVDPKMDKTDPDLKTRNSSGLVCKIDKITVMFLTSVFIILGYFTLRFYRRNYFYSSLHKEIVLTAVCGKVVETVIQTCKLPRTETIGFLVALFEY